MKKYKLITIEGSSNCIPFQKIKEKLHDRGFTEPYTVVMPEDFDSYNKDMNELKDTFVGKWTNSDRVDSKLIRVINRLYKKELCPLLQKYNVIVIKFVRVSAIAGVLNHKRFLSSISSEEKCLFPNPDAKFVLYVKYKTSRAERRKLKCLADYGQGLSDNEVIHLDVASNNDLHNQRYYECVYNLTAKNEEDRVNTEDNQLIPFKWARNRYEKLARQIEDLMESK